MAAETLILNLRDVKRKNELESKGKHRKGDTESGKSSQNVKSKLVFGNHFRCDARVENQILFTNRKVAFVNPLFSLKPLNICAKRLSYSYSLVLFLVQTLSNIELIKVHRKSKNLKKNSE